MPVSLFTELAFGKLQNSNTFSTTLKEFFNPYEKIYAYASAFYDNFIKQYQLKEFGSDILFFTSANPSFEKRLLSDKYLETTKGNYPYIFPNKSILSNEKNIRCSKNTYYDFDYLGHNINIYFKNNSVFFYSDKEELVNIVLDNDVNVLDCYYLGEGYIDLITETNGERSLIKTHMALNFFDYEYDYIKTTHIEDMEAIAVCDFNFDFDRIIHSSLDTVIFIKDNRKHKVDLVKRYYFHEGGNIYFNSNSEEEKAEYSKTHEQLRIEHLFLYDFIHVMGLNFMKNLDSFELNSFTFSKLQNKKMLFNNTLNGALNFINLTTDKDFYINKETLLFDVDGNFIHEYEKGNFKIEVALNGNVDKEVDVTFYLYKENNIIKQVRTVTKDRVAVFRNLRFYFKKLSYSKTENLSIDIKVSDNYNIYFDYEVEKESYDDLDTTVINDDMGVYRKLNKIEVNNSFNNKKEVAVVNAENSKLFISNYINSDSGRASALDRSVNFVTDDNTPSSLWLNIKDENYYLVNREEYITKRLNIKMSEEYIFSSRNYNTFEMTLKK